MASLNIPLGSMFAERYRIVRDIAQGGMGAVYEVVHVETGKTRALKVMLSGMLQNRDMHERFRREARVTATIESEFIVDVVDAGVDVASSMPFLVMEFLRGEELDKRLKRTGALSFDEAGLLLSQIAIALDKTHKASIVHRDLKPSNVFLTERDDGTPRVKILDFGIAKFISDGSTGAATTQNLGTPLFMAPEQFQAGSKVGPATDIFALGMMAYTMVVGVPYWQDELDAGTNVYAFVGLAMRGPIESASTRARRRGISLPEDFDAWFARMTAHSPGERFSGAKEAVEALRDVFGLGTGRSSMWALASLGVAKEPPMSAPVPRVQVSQAAQTPPGPLSAQRPAQPAQNPPIHAPTPQLAAQPAPLSTRPSAQSARSAFAYIPDKSTPSAVDTPAPQAMPIEPGGITKAGPPSVGHTGPATANTLGFQPDDPEKKRKMALMFGGALVSTIVVAGGALLALSFAGVLRGEAVGDSAMGHESTASPSTDGTLLIPKPAFPAESAKPAVLPVGAPSTSAMLESSSAPVKSNAPPSASKATTPSRPLKTPARPSEKTPYIRD